jgi:hypothetical protein
MEEKKNVFLIYEGDQWVSTDSLVLLGVFDDWNRAMDSAMLVVLQQIERNLHSVGDDTNAFMDNAHEDLEKYHIFAEGEASVYIREIELNQLYDS